MEIMKLPSRTPQGGLRPYSHCCRAVKGLLLNCSVLQIFLECCCYYFRKSMNEGSRLKIHKYKARAGKTWLTYQLPPGVVTSPAILTLTPESFHKTWSPTQLPPGVAISPVTLTLPLKASTRAGLQSNFI